MPIQGAAKTVESSDMVANAEKGAKTVESGNVVVPSTRGKTISDQCRVPVFQGERDGGAASNLDADLMPKTH